MPAKKNAIEIDLSKDVEIAIKEAREKAEKGMLSIALEELNGWEKKTRQAGDFISCGAVAREIVKICKDFNEWKQMSESLILLSKRRGQSTTVIAEAVKQGMEYIHHRDENTMELIKTLRTISEGKMYLEIESAELTRTLAKYQEEDGDIKLAAKTLQEVQVETLSKMGRDKKIDYILEQVRLCLDAKDYTRAIIIARKINTNNLSQDESLSALKIRYYTLMIRYHNYEKDYLSIAKAYQAIYNTPSVLADVSEWTKYLKLTLIYSILSPYGNEQNDLINRTFLLKNLKEIPTFRALVKLFLTFELIRFDDITAHFLPELNEFSEFSEQEREILHLRVCEHNLRVIAKYYTRITFKRLCSLLDLSIELVEKRLSDLVVNGSVYAKIDRPLGIINFSKPKKSEEVLNDWSHDISELLSLLEKTCHLIQRENMVFESKISL